MSDEKTGPVEVHNPVTQTGSTFAERKKFRESAESKASAKQVDESAETVEDKAVKPAETKTAARKKS